eukprot:15216514-Ditylum_brightwellii.AAC.1
MKEGQRKKTGVTVRLIMTLRGSADCVHEAKWENDIDSMLFNSIWENHQNQYVKEGVAVVDNAITPELKRNLSCNIDSLITRQVNEGEGCAGGEDYHPYSNRILRDIVHPAIYSYVKGVSKLHANVNDVGPCIFPTVDKGMTRIEDDASDITTKTINYEDFWGRKYESSTYQWMPTYFNIDKDGC